MKRATPLALCFLLAACGEDVTASDPTQPAPTTDASAQDASSPGEPPEDTATADEDVRDDDVAASQDTAGPFEPAEDCVPACPSPGFTSCDSNGALRTCEVTPDDCLDWAAPDDCDDGDPCTIDGCAQATCTHTTLADCCAPNCPEPQCDAGSFTCIDADTQGICNDPLVGYEPAADCGSFQSCLDSRCVEILAWSPGDTPNDTRMFFMIHAGICALLGPASDQDPRLCFLIDPAELQIPVDVPSLQQWHCDGDFGEDDYLPYDAWSEADVFAAADALLPCDGADPKLSIGAPVTADSGLSCLWWSQGTVSVSKCP